mmetsp:Transcript_88569/g.234252  ORF Transcript_88569/g.234252 Transcript_88569/m.234252 type:complete len:313 (+) Transcript_88569:167-1105(+)
MAGTSGSGTARESTLWPMAAKSTPSWSLRLRALSTLKTSSQNSSCSCSSCGLPCGGLPGGCTRSCRVRGAVPSSIMCMAFSSSFCSVTGGATTYAVWKMGWLVSSAMLRPNALVRTLKSSAPWAAFLARSLFSSSRMLLKRPPAVCGASSPDSVRTIIGTKPEGKTSKPFPLTSKPVTNSELRPIRPRMQAQTVYIMTMQTTLSSLMFVREEVYAASFVGTSTVHFKVRMGPCRTATLFSKLPLSRGRSSASSTPPRYSTKKSSWVCCLLNKWSLPHCFMFSNMALIRSRTGASRTPAGMSDITRLPRSPAK